MLQVELRRYAKFQKKSINDEYRQKARADTGLYPAHIRTDPDPGYFPSMEHRRGDFNFDVKT